MPRLAFLVLTATLAVAPLVTAPNSASADPLGPDCGTCQGSIYELLYDPTPVATTAGTKTYRITLKIDSSGYDGIGVGIDTVAVKIANALVSGVLQGAPGGVGNWTESENTGLNANGCSGGGNGFDCSQVVSGGTVPAVGGTLSWVWDLEVANGALLTNSLQSSVKVRYVDGSRGKVGDLVSEGITLQVIPEPGTALLFGLGLLGLVAAGRRS